MKAHGFSIAHTIMEEKKSLYEPSRDILNLYDDFLAQVSIDRLQKILARYELFKKIMDVPGDLVECGVFKGSGLYTLAKLQKLFMPNNERQIIGFDFFENNQDIALARSEDRDVLNVHANNEITRDKIIRNLAEAGINNVKLVPGNVVETTKAYVKENLGFRIALLYLDVDNYEGTLAVLNNLFPMVTPGGIVVFDEYAIHGHGESDAVDEYFRGRHLKPQTLPWANTPSAFFIKESF